MPRVWGQPQSRRAGTWPVPEGGSASSVTLQLPPADRKSIAGLPLPNRTVALGSNGSFHDRVGAGATNLSPLSTDGACDSFRMVQPQLATGCWTLNLLV